MASASKITSVTVNRAPVLTLWAAIVAERLGYAHDEALTLGKSIAGLNAQSKGRRLGIYGPPEPGGPARGKREPGSGDMAGIELMGRLIPAVRTREGLRAVHDGKPMTPESVERYLESKFKDSLTATREAMVSLADAFPPADLAARAFTLYEEFRPVIPPGKKGWGLAGVLDLERIRDLARPRTRAK